MVAQVYLPYAIADVRNAGLDHGLMIELVSKLAHSGKALAKGNDGCEPIRSAIATVERELANDRITADQAYPILDWLRYFRDVLGC